MARPLRIEFPGAIYHITSRGNERRDIFLDDSDRALFLKILGETVERWGWLCHAYCLMSNHYHILVETLEPNLSRGMRQLNGEYTQAFNRKRGRCGHVFQGRFKAPLVEKETHLLEVSRYIVLNPVRAKGMGMSSPEEWHWSSYRATAGIDKSPGFLTTKWVLARFGKDESQCRRNYKKFIAAGLGVRLDYEEKSGVWVGSDEYGDFLQELIKGRLKVKEHPSKQRRLKREELEKFLPLDECENLEFRNNAIYRAYLDGRFTQQEIGNHLALHYVTVSRIIAKKEKEKE
ncbi:MAG TPA: transposase [Acidobacteriota bacterium]|nr:transposase [Acidobacteriota bacterium]HNT18679.1 transposase [Acidobacteriota bacterium]